MLAKFEAKVMQEEQEYFTALASKSRAEERRNVLQKNLDESVKAQVPLENAAKEHGQAHARIDILYEQLFAGPTPGFPGEDKRETWFYTARSRNEEVKAKITKSRHAIRLMNMAAKNLERAGRFAREARSEVNNSIIFFDEAVYSLTLANEHVYYALSNAGKAEAVLEPLDEELNKHKRIAIAALHQAKIDVETLSSRTKILAAIEMVQPKLDDAHAKLDELIDMTKVREKRGLEEIRNTARQLEDARQELQEIRQQIFEEVAGFGEAAPPYTECCDRAEDFCVLPEYQEDEGDGSQIHDDFGSQGNRHERDEPSEGTQCQLREVSPQNKVFTSKDVELLD
jgi:xanthine/CO dehydrogenase XdhC/CoxF family maturation factor